MLRQLDAEFCRTIEQEIRIGRVGHEIFIRIETCLLGDINAR